MQRWRFRRMQPGEMNVDPIEAEFFSTASLDSLTDALVREALQNSIDARRDNEHVRVRISFPPPMRDSQRWFSRLWNHLEASHSGMAEVPNPSAPLPFLLIEDFGTRGLQGDPTQSEDDALDSPNLRNDFYYFWRNIGRSKKSSSDLGRWGLGKTVFPATSQVNAFLALTVRADDNRVLLMGQAVLRIHKLDGNRFYPYGYFGSFTGDFAMPLEDPDVLEACRSDFCITRSSEPGLTVMVPWPDPEITPDSVVTSVIRHYFVPILEGNLAVEVASASGVQRLDDCNLVEMISSGVGGIDAAESVALEALVALTRFGQSLPRADFARLSEPPLDSAPRWSPGCLDDAEGWLRSRFEAGQPIAFTVPIWVKPAAEEPVLSEFDVYLQLDESLTRGEEHFVREGITVAGVRGGVPKGIRAVLIARDPPIATLLGDAENPAHTEWQERSPKFKDRYRHGPFTLRYVRNAPREIARALARPAAGRHEGLLKHLFSLQMPTEKMVLDTNRTGIEAAPDGRSGAVTLGDQGDSTTLIHLQKKTGGFRLVSDGDSGVPSHVVVRVAYEVRQGNPFARYQRPDFDLALAPITIAVNGVEVQQVDGNLLVLRVLQPRFRLEVDGFDRQRDIRVRVATEEVRS